MQDSDTFLDRDETCGYIHSVETLSALDGPGLRYVVFMQGCPLHCSYCHNPDSRVIGGGETLTAESLTEQILRCQTYLTGGVTFSGGEPLVQAEFVYRMTRLLHRKGSIHVAIDTSGAIFGPEVLKTIDEADLILLDIKAFHDKTAIQLTGCDTQNAMRILQHCETTKQRVWLRHVLVPGITIFDRNPDGSLLQNDEDFLEANQEFINGIRFMARYSCIERIELLPFHKMGEFKWRELGLVSPLEKTPEPTDACVDWARKFVREVHDGMI